MATLTSGSFVIPQAEAAPLLTRSRKDSFVLQNATRVTVTGSGATVPVFTAYPQVGYDRARLGRGDHRSELHEPPGRDRRELPGCFRPGG